MDALVNAFMAIALLLILMLVIFIIDKVNTIEKETRKLISSVAEKSPRSVDPFMGLSGKRLWDAMTGRSVEGLDTGSLGKLRQLYEVVLSRHMEALYQEGYKDGQRGMAAEPRNTSLITTAHGQVQSWIPSAQANALYQCGLKASDTPQDQWGPIRTAMDEAAQFLLSKTALDASTPLSDWLMPQIPADTAPSSAPIGDGHVAKSFEASVPGPRISPP